MARGGGRHTLNRRKRKFIRTHIYTRCYRLVLLYHGRHIGRQAGSPFAEYTWATSRSKRPTLDGPNPLDPRRTPHAPETGPTDRYLRTSTDTQQACPQCGRRDGQRATAAVGVEQAERLGRSERRRRLGPSGRQILDCFITKYVYSLSKKNLNMFTCLLFLVTLLRIT